MGFADIPTATVAKATAGEYQIFGLFFDKVSYVPVEILASNVASHAVQDLLGARAAPCLGPVRSPSDSEDKGGPSGCISI